MSDPYAKVYHRLADEYPEMYDSPDLAGYVRLLVAADQAWPSRARWAGYVDDLTLARLVKTGLVIVDGSRYSIRGMDKERGPKRDAARDAARVRWGNADGNADRNADGNADASAPFMPTRPDQTKAEQTSPAQPSPDALRTYYDLKAGQVSEGAVVFLTELVDQFGDGPVVRAMADEARASPVDRKFISRVKGRLIIEQAGVTREVKERLRRSELEYQRSMREAIEKQTPEQRARTEAAKAEVDAFVRGLAVVR